MLHEYGYQPEVNRTNISIYLKVYYLFGIQNVHNVNP